ncbi:ABC transporter substrate-binding protein [Nocardia sp. NPDC004711]
MVTAVIALGALLPGCASSMKSQRDDKTIEIVTGYKKQADTISATLDAKFTARTGITVKVVNTGQENYESVDERLKSDAAAGTLPQLAAVGMSSVATYAGSAAKPLTTFLNSDKDFVEKNYGQSLLNAGTVAGDVYGVPYAMSKMMMFYNADAFKAAGLDPQSPPTSFSQLADDATVLAKSGANRWGVNWPNDMSSNLGFQNFLFSSGGQMMDAAGKKATFNEPAGVAVVKFWQQLVRSAAALDATQDQSDEAFFRGDLAVNIASTGRLAKMTKNARFDVRVAALPVPDGGSRKTVPGGSALISFSDNPAVWTVIKELTGPEGSAQLTKSTGYTPVSRTAASDPQYLGAWLAENPLNKQVLLGDETVVPWVQFPGPNAVEMSDTLRNQIESALTHGTDPKAALDSAAIQIQNLLN